MLQKTLQLILSTINILEENKTSDFRTYVSRYLKSQIDRRRVDSVLVANYRK